MKKSTLKQIIKEASSQSNNIKWEEVGPIDDGGTSNPLNLPTSELEDYDVEMIGYDPTTDKYYNGITSGQYGETDYDSVDIEGEMSERERETYKKYLNKNK